MIILLWSVIQRLCIHVYIILEWIRRRENDLHTFGELFFLCCDDVQDMELSAALKSLVSLFLSTAETLISDTANLIKNQVSDWILSQPRFIQALLMDLVWES